MSDAFFNLHPEVADALRGRIKCTSANEPALVSAFVSEGIFALRAAGIDAEAIRRLPRIPGPSDDRRVPVGIGSAALAKLRQFLLKDWATTGAGYSEFCARVLALPH